MRGLSPFLPSGRRTSCMLIVVYGLPASGKTTLCRALSTSPQFAENLSRSFNDACCFGIEGNPEGAVRHLCRRHVTIHHICFDAIEQDVLHAQAKSVQRPQGPVEAKREESSEHVPSGSFSCVAVCSDASPSSSSPHISSSFPASSSAPSSPHSSPSSSSPPLSSSSPSPSSPPLRSFFVTQGDGRGEQRDGNRRRRFPERRSASLDLSSGEPSKRAVEHAYVKETCNETLTEEQERDRDISCFDPGTWKRARQVAHVRIRDILERREVWYKRQAACEEEREEREEKGEEGEELNGNKGEEREEEGERGDTWGERRERRDLKERDEGHRGPPQKKAEAGVSLAAAASSLRFEEVTGNALGGSKRSEESRGNAHHRASSLESPCAASPPSALDAVASSPLLVLLVDDTMHLTSMRKKLFRLASQYRCAFHQVYLDVPLHHCLGRNALRFASARYSDKGEPARGREQKAQTRTKAKEASDTDAASEGGRTAAGSRAVQKGRLELCAKAEREKTLERKQSKDDRRTENGNEHAAAPPPRQVLLRHYESFCRQRDLGRDAAGTRERASPSERIKEETSMKEDEPKINDGNEQGQISSQDMTASPPLDEDHPSSTNASPSAVSPSSVSPSAVSFSCSLCGSTPTFSSSRQDSSVSSFCVMVCDACASSEESGLSGEKSAGKNRKKGGKKQKEGPRKWERLACRHSWRLLLREDQARADVFASAFRDGGCWRPACGLRDAEEGEKNKDKEGKAWRGEILAALDLALRRLLHSMITACSDRNKKGGNALPVKEWVKRKAEYLEECRRRLDRSVRGENGEKDLQTNVTPSRDETVAEAAAKQGERHAICVEMVERFRCACVADVRRLIDSAS
ncbi:conserved hypothetical protein [Neospora caninum Liverpool]|uniref:Uncharacterized protein n=1 Tax=Neospora caninum (strain Liverpool) TaxID=572307 RepID=F0VNF1_NEOCL|nr:conserved hypothetical protein [Neospora caninum Liverpool]CBZ55247.1 conserved hypothetical protein [Neospora caninum Liverpool]|eukprot:XP_003885275.1 conserved hypothetical protein [Neospora caninum Liverpool]